MESPNDKSTPPRQNNLAHLINDANKELRVTQEHLERFGAKLKGAGEQFSSADPHRISLPLYEITKASIAVARTLPFSAIGAIVIAFADFITAPPSVRINMIELWDWCENFGYEDEFRDLIEQYGRLCDKIEVERTRLILSYGLKSELNLSADSKEGFYRSLTKFIEDNSIYVPYKK